VSSKRVQILVSETDLQYMKEMDELIDKDSKTEAERQNLWWLKSQLAFSFAQRVKVALDG
jgi:hypothetical protein